MKILSIIPARGGSKGIPLKNIKLIMGKPLLYYTVKSAQQSKFINRIIVSTDHQRIAEIAVKLGAEVIKRPKKLSGDKIKLEPVIDHVLKNLQEKEAYIPNIIILLQNTSPLRTGNDIDNAIRILENNKFDSVLSVMPSKYFLWGKKGKNAIPINYNPLNRPNRQEIKSQFIENGAIYISKYLNYIQSKCRISGKIGLYIMKPEFSIDIDEKFDLELVKKIMKTCKII